MLVTVEELNGELVVPLPPAMLEQLGWTATDLLVWEFGLGDEIVVRKACTGDLIC